jgi:glutathione S-transferase
MPAKYKLIYFDLPGRAEITRMLFHFAGVEFEDYRMKREEWPELKAKMPFGQVPVLEVDGQLMSQSNSIARYVARKYGLAGNTDWDAAVCDQWVDGLADVLQHMVVWKYRGKNQEEKDEAKKTLYKTALPDFLKRVTAAIEKNSEGLIVCDKITWADIYIAAMVKTLGEEPGSVDAFPKILEHQKKVLGDARLQAYLSSQQKA